MFFYITPSLLSTNVEFYVSSSGGNAQSCGDYCIAATDSCPVICTEEETACWPESFTADGAVEGITQRIAAIPHLYISPNRKAHRGHPLTS